MREHLEAVERATGERPPELDPPPVPAAFAHVWRWFASLSAGRRPGGLGPAPLGWDEIAAWSRLVGVTPTPNDIAVLRDIDAAYLENAYAELDKGKRRK